jgi:FkbM family methyltransferase
VRPSGAPVSHKDTEVVVKKFKRTTRIARACGVYRPWRWVYRHLLRRQELRAYRDDLAFYSQWIGPNDLCFDVGANYGSKTEVFLGLGARVVAFEPQQECVKELTARLGGHPRLDLVPSAVAAQPGRATLYVRSHTGATSLLEDWEGTVQSAVGVDVTTLDEAIARYGVPKFCKIDVEGFELEVLKGLSEPVEVVSFEYHHREPDLQKTLACLEYLSNWGQLLVNVTPAEQPRFALPAWLRPAPFIDFFLHELPLERGYHYGDIFVRLEGP